MSDPNTASTGTPSSDASKTVVDEPKVIIDPSIAADGAQPAGTVPKTEPMEQQPDLTSTSSASSAPANEPVQAPSVDASATTASAPAGAPAGGNSAADDEEPQVPLKTGKYAKIGLVAAAVAGVAGLFLVAFLLLKGGEGGQAPVVVVPPRSTSASAGTAPAATLPEVRTPAPRRIDATGCTRGQWSIEGNELVFRNCAQLELAEPAR
jgi:hypothetical protein